MKAIRVRLTGLAVLAGLLAASCVRGERPGVAPTDGTGLVDPPAVYLTWQRDPTTTMTVQWHSEDAGGDVVEYQRLDETAWHAATGSHHPMPHADRLVHVTELTGLEPGTDYRFRLGGRSAVFTFRTMPRDARQAIRFVVGGDTMGVLNMFGDWFEETARQAARQDPLFAVIGGDIAYANGDPERVQRWYRWLAGWKRAMVTPDGRLIPLLVAIGNHEVQGGYDETPTQAPFFYSLFAMPGRRGYAVLDFGHYMSVVVLDSDHTHPVDGAQAAWLQRTLAERQDVPHVFVIYHVPAYPSVRSFAGRVSARIREHWVPLFERYGVAVAFEHHDHAYKRTHPIRANAVDPQGVLYLGDGGWGVLTRRPRTDWYLAKTAGVRHFILATIDSRRRSFRAIDGEGKVIDHVEQSLPSPAVTPR